MTNTEPVSNPQGYVCQDPQAEELWRIIFQQLMDVYITPEVMRRQSIGELPKPLDLQAAQIIFHPDGKMPQIRINSEVKAIAHVKLKPSMPKNVEEPVYANEVESVDKITLLDEDNPECGHATILKIENTWAITVDFRYNKELSGKHIKAAKQFLECAEYSFKVGYRHSFVENLLSAAELSVKATLLLICDPLLAKSKTHSTIQSRYNLFANLGNVVPEHQRTFNKLSSLRNPARYLSADLTLSEEDSRNYLNTVKVMIDCAEVRIRD